MLYFIFFTLFVTAPPSKTSNKLPPEPANYADTRFDLAKQEAMRGNYKKVIEIIRPLLYPTSRFSDEEKEIKALRLLGLSFWFANDLKNATQTFTVLLNRRPDFKLDPVLVPSGAIAFFKKIKHKLKKNLEEIRRKKLEELKKHAPILKQTVIVHKNYPLLALAPFGMGQFQNEQPIKGWVLFSIQTVSALISISSYMYLRNKYPKGYVPTDKVDSARQIQYLQVGSGSLFFGAWILGVVDSFINYKKQRTETDSKFIKRTGIHLYGAPDVKNNGLMFGIIGDF